MKDHTYKFKKLNSQSHELSKESKTISLFNGRSSHNKKVGSTESSPAKYRLPIKMRSHSVRMGYNLCNYTLDHAMTSRIPEEFNALF